jgi:hypothetical protein
MHQKKFYSSNSLFFCLFPKKMGKQKKKTNPIKNLLQKTKNTQNSNFETEMQTNKRSHLFFSNCFEN